ncbi:MAG TPA: hypothetical protein PLL69_01225 [Gemmatimonadales bacterium]|nr:hypothetical protein [Gemmatimonadales bacterium]
MQRIIGTSVLLLAACGGRGIESGPAPERATVEVWAVALEDNSNSTLIQARNNGTVPVMIGELRLHTCSNLRQECTTHHPNVRIEPGQTGLVARLDPSNHNQRPRFGYEFKWRVLVDPVVTAVVNRPGERRMSAIKVEDFVALVQPVEADGACFSDIPGQLPPGYRGYAMRFGPDGGLPVRSVIVQLDGQGNVIKFSDSRGDLRVPPPGVEPPRPIANPGARTSISLNLLSGIGFLWNHGPDGTVQEVSVFGGADLLDAPSLGRPRLIIERIVRECGTGS